MHEPVRLPLLSRRGQPEQARKSGRVDKGAKQDVAEHQKSGAARTRLQRDTHRRTPRLRKRRPTASNDEQRESGGFRLESVGCLVMFPEAHETGTSHKRVLTIVNHRADARDVG